jgi:hypothetical protein
MQISMMIGGEVGSRRRAQPHGCSHIDVNNAGDETAI